jgi:hypothetical protein
VDIIFEANTTIQTSFDCEPVVGDETPPTNFNRTEFINIVALSMKYFRLRGQWRQDAPHAWGVQPRTGVGEAISGETQIAPVNRNQTTAAGSPRLWNIAGPPEG